MTETSLKPISVSQCVDLIRISLQAVIGDLIIEGEISGLQKRSGNTLVFFSLKDETSYVDCFMLSRELKAEIEDGMEVQITGYPSLYKKSGKFHIRVKRVEPKGQGALQKQLELTKKKLEEEGLFDQSRKRPLPKHPKQIGIVTSEDAAALTDIIRVLSNRWPYAELTLVPSQVQGKPAIKKIIHAIDVMEKQINPEVIILTRGGGNLEDLQSFNAEELARRIFSCTIPIVVGVGHERDWTIADLVADVRAATPSNAAELITPDTDDVLLQLDALTDGLRHTMRRRLELVSHSLYRSTSLLSSSMETYLAQFSSLLQKIAHYGERLMEFVQHSQQMVTDKHRTLAIRMQAILQQTKKSITQTVVVLEKSSPTYILEKGYSITTHKGKVLKSRKQIKEHDILTTTLSDGTVESEVTKS